MQYGNILFELADDIARITLDRPDKLNSFNAAMHAELRDALERTRAGGVRALLVTGAGRAFCAGQDLSERKFEPGIAPDLGLSLELNYNPLVKTLRSLEMPVVCAVNGVAAGAGANFALACDIVLAARSASFVQAFCKLGLVPDCGGSYFLPRLVGSARALGLALTGEPLSAERAEQWGLIWKCLDDAELLPEAERLVRHFATAPTHGLALAKRALNASIGNSLVAQLALERDLQKEAGRGDDYREGVMAFREKRSPRFTGK